MKDYQKFLLTCINNREIMGYSEREMASYLIDVSEKNYIDFENGKYLMNDENIERIIRVLAIKNIEVFNLDDYIDTTGLSKEEIEDLSEIVSQIVGDEK